MEAEEQRLEFVEGAPWGLSIVGLCPQMALPVTPTLGESCCPFSSLERFPTRAQRLNHLFSTATPRPQVSCWWTLPALLRAAWAVWSSTSSPPHPCRGQPCGPSERRLLCLPARVAGAARGSCGPVAPAVSHGHCLLLVLHLGRIGPTLGHAGQFCPICGLCVGLPGLSVSWERPELQPAEDSCPGRTQGPDLGSVPSQVRGA